MLRNKGRYSAHQDRAVTSRALLQSGTPELSLLKTVMFVQ